MGVVLLTTAGVLRLMLLPSLWMDDYILTELGTNPSPQILTGGAGE